MASDITRHQGITLRSTRPEDIAAIADLHARVFGPGRFARTAYRLRDHGPKLSPYCLVAESFGVLSGSVRFSPVTIGGRGGSLLLGPLVVDPSHGDRGIGVALVQHGLAAIRSAGLPMVILVGDMSYYGRLGFAPVPPGRILFPGPVDPARLLAAVLDEGALTHFSGIVAASPA